MYTMTALFEERLLVNPRTHIQLQTTAARGFEVCDFVDKEERLLPAKGLDSSVYWATVLVCPLNHKMSVYYYYAKINGRERTFIKTVPILKDFAGVLWAEKPSVNNSFTPAKNDMYTKWLQSVTPQ